MQPSQTDQILDYLRRHGRITRLIADHEFDCASLTSRISELRKAGHKIQAWWKRDTKDRWYTEYRLGR